MTDTKMKGKRIETEGSQMPEVLSLFKTFIKDQEIKSNLATIIPAFEIMKKNAEFSPEQYLPLN